MGSPIDSMMQNVYAYLLAAYQSSMGSATSAVLAFEPIGIPISNAMFMLPGSSTASRDMATEQVSELANFLPGITNGMISSSERRVDDFYKLLFGAQPSAGTDVDSFAAVKAAAQQLFEPTLNTFELPNYPYHPIFATPPDWYDETNVQNWTSYPSGQGTGSTSTSGTTSPPAAPPPAPVLSPIGWHTFTPIRPPILEEPVLRPATTPFRARMFRPEFMVARPVTAAAAPPRAVSFEPELLINRPSIRQLVLATRQQAASTTPQPVTSTAPSVSFEYCLVILQRRWLSGAFLNSPGWYLNGYESGSISNGSATPSSAPFDALPTAFIAIKNLKIQAQWSPGDSQTMQASTGLGPFSLTGQTFDAASGTLSCAGMQIIAWVCERQPLLPPQADPTLPAATSSASGTIASTPAASSTSPTSGANTASSTQSSDASSSTAATQSSNTSSPGQPTPLPATPSGTSSPSTGATPAPGSSSPVVPTPSGATPSGTSAPSTGATPAPGASSPVAPTPSGATPSGTLSPGTGATPAQNASSPVASTPSAATTSGTSVPSTGATPDSAAPTGSASPTAAAATSSSSAQPAAVGS